jgi:hypothetical protein
MSACDLQETEEVLCLEKHEGGCARLCAVLCYMSANQA